MNKYPQYNVLLPQCIFIFCAFVIGMIIISVISLLGFVFFNGIITGIYELDGDYIMLAVKVGVYGGSVAGGGIIIAKIFNVRGF